MDVEFDPAKAAKTLAERGLDFLRAVEVVQGLDCVTAPDLRHALPGPAPDLDWPPGRPARGGGLDRSRRRVPRHLDEEGQ